MPIRRLTRRLDELGERVGPPERFRIVVISPDRWPTDDLTAYDEARERGDTDEQDAIIWRVTGQRVHRAVPGVHAIRDHAPIRLLEIRCREDGPQ
jgi:hypothetical protein